MLSTLKTDRRDWVSGQLPGASESVSFIQYADLNVLQLGTITAKDSLNQQTFSGGI
jgi:hypothetical protein